MRPIIAHVVGARPNFMKAAPVMRALGQRGVGQWLIHTGQHYSDSMSAVFFEELGLPRPDVNLGVGSGTHAGQTAAVMAGLESLLVERPVAMVLVYGDVNSTLAAALVAAKIGQRFAHVEAGLRSFDRTMPEEVNRLVTDALADLLFTTSPEAADNLVREGVDMARVHFVGNPMIDTLLRLRPSLRPDIVRERLGVPTEYGVVTLHRPANVDHRDAAAAAVDALLEVSRDIPLVVPLHPRGREMLAAAGLADGTRIRIVEPLGYLDFVSLVADARLVVTDSGGVQEETTMLGVPCLTLRPNTERPITISHGTNRLVDPAGLATAARDAMSAHPISGTAPPLWDGRAGERIAGILEQFLA